MQVFDVFVTMEVSHVVQGAAPYPVPLHLDNRPQSRPIPYVNVVNPDPSISTNANPNPNGMWTELCCVGWGPTFFIPIWHIVGPV